MVVDAAHEPSPAVAGLKLRSHVAAIAALTEAVNIGTVLAGVLQPDCRLPEMAASWKRTRPAPCPPSATTDDRDRIARWHLETAFHAPQEGWEVSYWPRYAPGRLWWPERLAARLIAATTSGRKRWQSRGSAAGVLPGQSPSQWRSRLQGSCSVRCAFPSLGTSRCTPVRSASICRWSGEPSGPVACRCSSRR